MDEVLWSYSEDDLETKSKITLGIEKARTTEIVQGVNMVVGAALGVTPQKKSGGAKDGLKAEMMLASVLGGKVSSKLPEGVENPVDKMAEAFKRLEQKQP